MNIGEQGVDWDFDETGRVIYLENDEEVDESHSEMDDVISSLQEDWM